MKSAAETAAFEIKDLEITLGGKRILKGITLDILNGNNYCLVGPNGSGKSTMLNILTQHLAKYDGTVLYAGKDLKKYSKKELAQTLAYVPQFDAGAFDFTVYEYVMLGRNPHKGLFDKDTEEDDRIVSHILQKTNLADLEGRSILTLSGGEKQRAILARALVQEPDVLILDEPSNHLDITNQIKLMNLIVSQQITTVTALHDLNLASQFFGKLIVLKEGRIYAHGNTADIINPHMIRDVYHLNSEIEFNRKTGHIDISFYNQEDI